MAEITRVTVLLEMQERAWHNVLCTSENYLMSKPRLGMEQAWQDGLQKAIIIDELLQEEREATLAEDEEMEYE